jgi:ubiquinone/menaquinone biosynthesis C-methylase UbiE
MSRAYVLGHSEHERRRLQLQSAMLAPHTMHFLVEAGIAEGMRVLDLGCGVGDVSLLLGHLVGPAGAVQGVDMDEASLSVARSRAQQHQFANVAFDHADITNFRGSPVSTDRGYDAVVGRLILQHMEDPIAILRRAASLARPGGIVAFEDCTPGLNVPSWPKCPQMERALDLIARFAVLAIPQHAAGTRLYHWFLEAGLNAPRVETRVLTEGGADSVYYDWLAETLRSMMPRAVSLGLAEADEFNLDTLAAEIREEALAAGTPMNAAVLTGVFARI